MSFNIFLLLTLCSLASCIDHCLQEENGQCLKCQDYFFLSNNDCFQCKEEGCLRCKSLEESSCSKCEQGYDRYAGKCGIKKCKEISNCRLCSTSRFSCLSCMKGCDLNEGICSCKKRNIIVIVCVVVSLIIITVLMICLTNPKCNEKYNRIELAAGMAVNNTPMQIQNQLSGLEKIVKEKPGARHVLDIVDLDVSVRTKNTNTADKSKVSSSHSLIPADKDSVANTSNCGSKLERSKIVHLPMIDGNLSSSENLNKPFCDYCMTEHSSRRLPCGCWLCEKDLKKAKSSKSSYVCPVCNKKSNIIYK